MVIASGLPHMPGLKIINYYSDFVFGTIDGVFIAVWRGSPTLISIGHLEKQCIPMAHACPGTPVYVSLMEEGSKVPPAEVRERITQTLREMSKVFKCMAFIIEGSSVRNSIVRTVLTVSSMVKAQSNEIAYFSKPSLAQNWINSKVTLPSSFNLTDNIEVLRATMKK